ncbi:MAG: restriction endonuclease, partial [Bacteroidetes bacterium]|nr:restriction endonuclease [Bacteroidota bacterium]
MNTVAKGDAFEDVSYDLIKEELEGYRLGLIPASCKLKRKPKYYSDKRKGFITFDLSIEVYRSDTENMLMLWLIECKDYSSKNVPVDDVEEFESKVRQVTGLNAKAVMISTSPYSDGSYNVAKGYGIMLIEVSGNIAFNIILHRISVKEARKLDKLSEVIISEETYNDPIIQTHVHRRWNQNIERKLLLALVKYTRKLEIQNANDYVPYLSREYIEEIVDSLIDAVDQSNVSRGYGVNLDRLMTFLEEMFGLNFETGEDLGYDANDRKILGHC